MRVRSAALVLIAFLAATVSGLAQDRPDSLIAKRVPWTTSRITGSPNPPLPYISERLYPNLAFDQPVAMVSLPGSDRTFLVERKGRIVQLPPDQKSDTVQLLLDGAKEVPQLTAVYGLAFHPKFAQNRLCFVCYIRKPELEDGTRLSRFKVTGEGDALRIDPDSETTLLTWKSGGHNGGCLKFGPDGFLYVSTGDGSPPAPADVRRSGQDISDLLASILRIDVDRESNGLAYSIPADNPFVDREGARGEVWAYGLRNPWRMSFDRETGDLWLGDVGWQLWECVHRIEKGGNYGWSIQEGPQIVHPEWQRGPTRITPPVVAHPRAEAASVTGGFVYRGSRLKELSGAYIYGDYVTGRFWAVRHDGEKVTSQTELADTTLALIAFHEDQTGELSFMDYNGGGIYRLVPNTQTVDSTKPFPRKLSETGLFASTKNHTPAVGVIPFSVNAEEWMDGARAERFVAVPGNGRIVLRKPQGRVPTNWGEFPADTVLVKTISYEREAGNAESRRRMVTQILHNRGEVWRGNSGEWFGYSYVWNKEQTDAVLASGKGAPVEYAISDSKAPGGKRTIHRMIGSQGECYLCHNPWAGYRLGFTASQLARKHDYGGVEVDQLAMLRQSGLLETPDIDQQPPMSDPHDTTADLASRARSWLHVNCAHCHRFGGGGTASIDLRFGIPLDETKATGQRPTQGTFGIAGSNLIRPGDPYRSLLLYRISKTGRGHMPHIGSRDVDPRGMKLIEEWISQMPPTAAPKALMAQQFSEQSLMEDAFRNGSSEAISALLKTTSGSLRLAASLEDDYVDEKLRKRILDLATKSRADEVRGLFERFLPEDQRPKRLGSSVNPQSILTLRGDASRGADLFANAKGLQCRNCHAMKGQGGGLGPDLTHIAKTRSREELLDAILNPSKKIEPKFQTWLLETTGGRLHSGLLVGRTEEKLTLKTEPKKSVTIPSSEIEILIQQQKSLMPELQFKDLTAQQLADLLQFLAMAK